MTHPYLHRPGGGINGKTEGTSAFRHKAPARPSDRYEELDSLSFLVRTSIDHETLARAHLIATGWNVNVHTVLLTLGWISVPDYVAQLARVLGAPSAFEKAEQPIQHKDAANSAVRPLQIDATCAAPSEIAGIIAEHMRNGVNVELTSSLRPDFVCDDNRQRRVRATTEKLLSSEPLYSAASIPPLWLIATIVGLTGLFLGAAIIDAQLAYFIIACVAAIPFAFIVCLRLLVLVTNFLMPQPRLTQRQLRFSMADLPVYTILVPLYDEADIFPDLVDALVRLNYPCLLYTSDAADD